MQNSSVRLVSDSDAYHLCGNNKCETYIARPDKKNSTDRYKSGFTYTFDVIIGLELRRKFAGSQFQIRKEIIMSFTIISNEDIRICNTNKEARKVAAALRDYIRQLDHLDAIRSMSAQIILTVDNETAEVKTDSYVPGNIVCDFAMAMTDDGPVIENTPQENITPVPIWKDAYEFNTLVDRIVDGKDISAKVSLYVTQSMGALYSIDYWGRVFAKGPIEGVSCRLMYREVDMGLSYSCIGLSGDIVGEIPFDKTAEDVSDINSWASDDVMIVLEPEDESNHINVEDLRPFAEAFADKYELEINAFDKDEFFSNDVGSFSQEELPDLVKDMQFFLDYAEEHGLRCGVESYLYAEDGSFALAHIYESDTGKLEVEYCKF